MLDANRLRHMPFFEEIAALEENGDAWKSATAGLVTLRLVDSWLESGVGNAGDDEWNFRSVCAAVDNVSERSPMRSLLTSVLMAMREGKPGVRAVVPSLMAYAKALEWDAKWELAMDVYETLLAHLHPIEDSEACVAANIRLGVAYRSISKFEESIAAYGRAFEVGNASGDLVGVLKARIGEAEVAMHRGNLPEAATRFDELINSAATAGLRDIRARALMGRAGVATLSQQYELAIRLGYQALEHQENPIEKDRVLSNIAVAFHHLGVFSAARDAYLVLSVTAREQYLRWTAALNLLDLAAETGSQVLFEQYSRQLAAAKLPPQLEAAYELTLGTGLKRFGQIEIARRHLVHAVELSRVHSLNQYLHEAEKALSGLNAPAPLHRSPTAMPTGVEEVALAIRELRELSGIA